MLRATCLAAALLLSPLAAPAQTGPDAFAIDPGLLDDDALIALRTEIARQLARSAPVAITGIRSGVSLPARTVYAGAALTNRRDRRFEDDWDGSLAFGAGFGDAGRGIGVTLAVDITSVSPFHFGQSGKAGLSFHRNFGPADGSWRGGLALGVENLVTWGDSQTLSREVYVAGTWTRPGSATMRPIMATFGYGSGIAAGGHDPAAFGGLGIGLGDRSSASLAWNGDEVIAGVSFWPDRPSGVVASISVGDLTDRIDGRRAILTLSWTRQLGRR